MNDDYTMEMRLCDDDGKVSRAFIVDERETLDKCCIDRLNRLRNMTLHGDKPEIVASFMCTGHAHLAGEHIRCSSPFHGRKDTLFPRNSVEYDYTSFIR